MPLTVPYRMTGPATVNIFAPTPRTKPSLRESIAWETTAFAKPVIGTRVPAPPTRAKLSKIPMPVRMALMTTKVRLTITGVILSSIMPPLMVGSSCRSSSPSRHIMPPTAKAQAVLRRCLLLGLCFFMRDCFSSFVRWKHALQSHSPFTV